VKEDPKTSRGPYRTPAERLEEPIAETAPRSERAPGCLLVLLGTIPFICFAVNGQWREREGMIATLALVLAASTFCRALPCKR
jgi:hypothetical protein